MAAIQCDQRLHRDFKYQRYFWDEDKRLFTLIEIIGSEFSSIIIPDLYTHFYRDIFSKPMNVKNASHLQALHHSRKHDKCFSLTITKCASEPISYKPFVWAEGVKRKVQYLLLDVDSMIAFLEKLPEYVEDVIPCLASNAKAAEVEYLSPYATYTTTSQVRGSCILKEILSARKEINKLELSLVQFPKSYSLQLRYMMAQGSAGYGVYIPTMVYDWLMEDRTMMMDVAQRMKNGLGNEWSAVDTAAFKRDMEDLHWSSDEFESEGHAVKRSKSEVGQMLDQIVDKAELPLSA